MKFKKVREVHSKREFTLVKLLKRIFMKLLLFLLAFTFNSMAERFILVDSQSTESITALKATKIKTFSLNDKRLEVIEFPSTMIVLPNLIQSLTGAQEVIYDQPIFIESKREPSKWGGAWHVKEMRYDDLPSDNEGREVVIAVLDTGVDYNHEALKSRIWKNTNEIPNNGIDDDENGYVDDTVGFDFTKLSDHDPMDTNSHGTHCAGIIASLPHPRSGARGISTKARIMPIRIIGDDGKGFLSDAIEGIQYAVDNGAEILSNSWRFYKSWTPYYDEKGVKLLKEAIHYANEKEIPFIAAAGNESNDNDTLLESSLDDKIIPAGLEGHANLLIVASAKKRKKVSGFTNFGENSVFVAAPGSSIHSTTPYNTWTRMSGTSMATPLVAGALARALSMGMNVKDAFQKILATSNQTLDWRSKVKYGHIDLIKFFD